MEVAEVPQGHTVRGNQEAKESHYVMDSWRCVQVEFFFFFYLMKTEPDMMHRSHSLLVGNHINLTMF